MVAEGERDQGRAPTSHSRSHGRPTGAGEVRGTARQDVGRGERAWNLPPRPLHGDELSCLGGNPQPQAHRPGPGRRRSLRACSALGLAGARPARCKLPRITTEQVSHFYELASCRPGTVSAWHRASKLQCKDDGRRRSEGETPDRWRSSRTSSMGLTAARAPEPAGEACGSPRRRFRPPDRPLRPRSDGPGSGRRSPAANRLVDDLLPLPPAPSIATTTLEMGLGLAGTDLAERPWTESGGRALAARHDIDELARFECRASAGSQRGNRYRRSDARSPSVLTATTGGVQHQKDGQGVARRTGVGDVATQGRPILDLPSTDDTGGSGQVRGRGP